MYSLEHFRMLVVAADTGSFSACARALGKAQSTISQGIAALEDDLNVVLFDRSTRKPTPTADGARILEFARSILLQVDDLEAATDAIHKGEEALVRVVIDDALALPKIDEILLSFESGFPTTGLEVITAASPDIRRMIKTSRADIGVMFAEIELDNALEHCFIGNLPFHAVCSEHHPLTKLKRVQMSDLLPHRQILLRGEVGAGLDLFPKMSTLAWYANDFFMISHLVSAGFGWAYVPAHFTESHMAPGPLRRLDFSFDHKPWSPPVELIKLKHTPMGPAASWLYEQLKSLIAP